MIHALHRPVPQCGPVVHRVTSSVLPLCIGLLVTRGTIHTSAHTWPVCRFICYSEPCFLRLIRPSLFSTLAFSAFTNISLQLQYVKDILSNVCGNIHSHSASAIP